MPISQFYSWFCHYQQQALLCNERRLIVLRGDETWLEKLLQPILSKESAKNSTNNCTNDLNTSSITQYFCYGDNSFLTANIQPKNYREKLGSESDVVIFTLNNTDTEFNVDAFAALSGTLVAGGVFFVILPAIEQQSPKLQRSLFLRRLLQKIANYPELIFLEQHNVNENSINNVINSQVTNNNTAINHTSNQVNSHKASSKPLDFDCVTAEQVQAVNAVKKVLLGHRKRPLVLTADRGRGKSSALALACASLLEDKADNKVSDKTEPFNIIVTAPDIQALSVFFRQLKRSLPDAEFSQTRVKHAGGTIDFMPVDLIIKTNPKTSLLLVDEAAAIPVYLLTQLLTSHHRMVFASTVHGYEGAGRGFTLKFQQTLDKQCPQWQLLHIQQPIRWREDDPLEQFVFASCLLNAPLTDASAIEVNAVELNNRELMYRKISAVELLDDETLLAQVFSLLVTAHYQTSANDLKMLLDNPNVHLLCAFTQDDSQQGYRLIAVSLLLAEGKVADKVVATYDIDAVKNSQKRLRNQLLPQSLFSHCGVEQAFDYRYFRVLRIAVHPQLQHRGIGSYLLKQIKHYCSQQGADFVGASFGANAELLSFWLKANFHLARIGFTKDNASGEYSALVLQPLSRQATLMQQQLSTWFYRSFDYLLVDEYQQLDSKLVKLVLHHCSHEYLITLTDYDKQNVAAFVKGERMYSNCVYSLYLWLKQHLVHNNQADDNEVLVLISRILQKQSMQQVCQTYQLTGKKMLNNYLKTYIEKYS